MTKITLSSKKIPLITLAITALLFIVAFSGFKTFESPLLNTPSATGAPFNKYKTCAQKGCHGGGHYGGSITTQLLGDDSIPVTDYTPGKAYVLKIALIPTKGVPAKYGFQTTCAKVADLADINSWGVLPGIEVNKLDKGHHYVEHADLVNKLDSGTIYVPWNGPPAGTGDVIFYTAGNLANHDYAPTGDQIVNNNLTIHEVASGLNPAATKYDTRTEKNIYALSLYSQNGCAGLIRFHNGAGQQRVQVIYTDIQGTTIQTVGTIANKGDNIWPIPQNKLHGLVVAQVITQDGVRTSLKLNLTY